MLLITKGIIKREKPSSMQVLLPSAPGKQAKLISFYRNGDSECLSISKKVASLLISNGVAYGS